MFADEGAQAQLSRRIPLATIDRVVSARLGQTRAEGNEQPAVFNRQIAMYLAKHVGGWSTTRIGRFYNGRDHSTVCYALKRIATLREDDPEVDGLVSSLMSEIKLDIVHGLLHMHGFDDRTPADARRMKNTQEKILRCMRIQIGIVSQV